MIDEISVKTGVSNLKLRVHAGSPFRKKLEAELSVDSYTDTIDLSAESLLELSEVFRETALKMQTANKVEEPGFDLWTG